jgi:hypothetical protein
MARKPADKVGIIVRFSEALRRRIEKAAKAHNRSMNSEIVGRLEESFELEAAGEAGAITAYHDRKKLIEVRESLDEIITALGWAENPTGEDK